jgi:hypothetical protein
MISDDAKTARWRGKDWQQDQSGDDCQGDDPKQIVEKLKTAQAASH